MGTACCGVEDVGCRGVVDDDGVAEVAAYLAEVLVGTGVSGISDMLETRRRGLP